MKRLTSVSVASVFKMSLVLGAAAGLLAGITLMAFSFKDGMWMEGLLTLLLAPVIYGVLGALVNSVLAWVFNAAASRLGGIELTLED